MILNGYRPWRHEIERVWSEQHGLQTRIVPRRKPGSAADVAAFEAALAELETATDKDVSAAEYAANTMGLTGRARRRFLGSVPESDDFCTANDAVIEAARRISPWQERQARARIARRRDGWRGRVQTLAFWAMAASGLAAAVAWPGTAAWLLAGVAVGFLVVSQLMFWRWS